ncbi:MAG: T9SS type A sorting domain-containing protein [Bacteroidaceae bacterium]|nr:T9SS type A sorting domain-containing protein [Bacteroidaceae bacterium]
MKKNLTLRPIIISLFLFVPTLYVHADRILYTYDAAGNRTITQRDIPFNRQGDGESRQRTYQDSLSFSRITIYPNPTQGDLKIEITGTDSFDGSSMGIFSMNGILLYHKERLSAVNEIDITDYPDATYLFVIRINGKNSVWKIIKN